ncbi:hypothetical protein BO71DRAFT_396956, partial [Aspergillus ellipticus CBS 707.79]
MTPPAQSNPVNRRLLLLLLLLLLPSRIVRPDRPRSHPPNPRPLSWPSTPFPSMQLPCPSPDRRRYYVAQCCTTARPAASGRLGQL